MIGTLIVLLGVLPVLVFKIMAALCTLFLAILFLQSSYDKIADYKGNLDYFRAQFAKSPLKNMVGLLLPVLTILEAATGLSCVAGNVMLLFFHDPLWLGIASILASVTLLCLLTGQRLAKDYAGSAALTGYFIIAMFALLGFAGSI
jgi:hypothetical protein